MPTQLEEGQSKLQAVKAEKQTIEEKLVALTVVSTPPTPVATVPLDPEPVFKRTMTMTLADIKVQIDLQRKQCATDGWSEEATNECLTGLAKDLGTTLEELASIQVAQAPVAPKAVVKKPTQSTQPSKPKVSTAKPSQPSVGAGGYPITDYDKNGDGIEDSLADVTQDSGGTTSDPNFMIHAN